MIDTILFFSFAALICFMLFTRQGKNAFVRVALGEIVKDYGVIGKEKLATPWGFKMPQHSRLLKVKKGEDVFYVLEANFFGAVYYMKMSQAAMREIANIVTQDN